MMNTADSPIPRTKLSDRIYDVIYQRIVMGQYPVESKLPTENELAREFKASRPVVRETLSTLREDGLVITRERVGNFVVGLEDHSRLRFLPLGSLADVQRCFVFRSSLEAEAAFLAATQKTPQDIKAMRDAQELLERLVDEQKPSIDADYAFHVSVSVASHNPFFLTTLKSLINHVRTGMDMCRNLSLIQPELHNNQMKLEHQGIIDAIAAGDAKGAHKAMRHHLDESCDRVFAGQHLL